MFVFQPANVLQAILCLINELDRDALEVVDDAIRNRLDMPLWLSNFNYYIWFWTICKHKKVDPVIYLFLV